ncbi:YveK family protein [Frondihabitans cladoniiphilus]|uniref:Capsular polysaccharide biosynthesis protein n=1 Tax=Frondihabitans cladoniiphilus TaxID=715785 RepID=A0ABP8VWJ7_9MICO
MPTETRRSHGRVLVLLAVLGIVVGAAAGYGGSKVTTPEYSSTAQLSWDPASLRYSDSSAYVPDSVSLGIQTKTQSLKVLSDAVVDPASDALGISPAALRRAVTTTTSTTSNQLTVSATAGTAQAAHDIVDRVVTTYQTSVVSTLQAQYTQQADALSAPIAGLQQQIASVPDSAYTDNLASQLATLTTQQLVLRSEATAPATPLSVLSAASVAKAPTGASAKTLSVVGGGLGLLVGIVVFALLRTTRWSRAEREEPTVSRRRRLEADTI